MKQQELIDWIQLINSDGIGPVSFYKLLNKHGSAAEALKYLSEKQLLYPRKDAEYVLKKAQQLKVAIIARTDELYPQNIAELNDAPPILFVKGRTDILNYPLTVSIVGSRNATVNGRKIASKIAYDLTQNDVIVISGMARGIDTAAHKGALYAKEQQGATIAVLGTGVDVPYPAENNALYEQICEQGAVISEFVLGTTPQAANFPRRNRLVSALGVGTLVVEASLNSGSLITARTALEQGKDIFAVPGSPLDGRSAGANKLIREGAILTESADDILQTLTFTQNQQIKNYTLHSAKVKPLDKPQKNDNICAQTDTAETKSNAEALTALIPPEGIGIDELIRTGGGNAEQTMMMITELELEGVIERVNGSTLALKNRKNRKNR